MKFRKLWILLGIFLIGINWVLADDTKKDKNFVNIYLFYSDTCKHCESERKLLSELEREYENIRIYEYEITNDENAHLLEEIAKLKGTTATGVPFTIIGDMVYKGYSIELSKPRFMATIEYYLEYGYGDIVGEFIGNIELPEYSLIGDIPPIDKYIDDYINYKINFPLIGEVNTKDKTISFVVILMGLASLMRQSSWLGWLLLIGIFLSDIKNQSKVKIGIIYLMISILTNIFFIMTGIGLGNISRFMNVMWIIVGIGIVGFIIMNSLTENKRKDITNNNINLEKISVVKKILIVLGIILFCFIIRLLKIDEIIQLNNMFLRYLSINNLTVLTKITYIILYIIIEMFIDIVIFFIGVKILEKSSNVIIKK